MDKGGHSHTEMGCEKVVACVFWGALCDRRMRVDVEVNVTEVLFRKVRFRWFQDQSDKREMWGLHNIYVGTSCPSYCTGHGTCVQSNDGPICICDSGYEGKNRHHMLWQVALSHLILFAASRYIGCSPVEVNPPGFLDRFDGHRSWWKRPLGGAIIHGSLCFEGNGTRRAETHSLDTSSIRFVLN